MEDKSALLIVDVQRGFVNEHTKAVPPLVEKEQFTYRLVWAAKLEYGDSSPFLRIRRHSGFGDVDNPAELAFALRPEARTIIKHGYSAVTEELLQELKEHDITTVDLMGVDTDQCVLATAFALFDAGITPRVVASHCASTGGPDMHEMGIHVMRRALGGQNVVAHP